MRYGYARVSTEEQSLARQKAALADAGCHLARQLSSMTLTMQRCLRRSPLGRAVTDRIEGFADRVHRTGIVYRGGKSHCLIIGDAADRCAEDLA